MLRGSTVGTWSIVNVMLTALLGLIILPLTGWVAQCQRALLELGMSRVRFPAYPFFSLPTRSISVPS